jgi:uncharacterized protein
MKRYLLSLVLVMLVVYSMAQDATGTWNGLLNVNGMHIRLVFHITKTDKGYQATMDSPDQGAKGISMTSATFENNELKIEMSAAKISYIGKLVSVDSIEGIFNQAGMPIKLNLSQKAISKPFSRKPQEPKTPYPYNSEDITFENKNANITLAGTFTYPKTTGKFPMVVLITGSGPQNRDEELMGHKPFLVLADYLTRQGIGVLRFDDRGMFGSKGVFKTATTYDFATDVEAAVEYLKTRKETNLGHIGLIGHSEGGIIAPIVASRNADINFIIMMAGTGVRGLDLLLMQAEAISKASGVSENDIRKTTEINRGAYQLVMNFRDTIQLKSELKSYAMKTFSHLPKNESTKGITEETYTAMLLGTLTSPWMSNFIQYNPTEALKKVKCHVLAINGDKDLQVPAKANLPAIEKALKEGGNDHFQTEEIKGVNHLFQECKTGLPAEYAEIEQTIAPKVLIEISDWIKDVVKE